MNGQKVTGALLGLALVAIPATPTQAFFNHCKKCAQPTTTFYAPVAVAPVMAPPPTVVNYMPQTAFRSVVVNRPVTTMVAQPACGPCGQPTTVMRPVTTFVTEQQLVPYTTFRPVVTAMPVTVGFAPAVVAPAPAPACCGATPVPTLSTTNFAPAPMAAPLAAPLAAPAPACCGNATTPTPSLSNYSPAPTTTTIIPSTVPQTTTLAPATTVVPATNLAPPSANSFSQGTPGSTLNSLTPTPDPTLNAPAAAPSALQAPATLPQTFAPQNGTPTGTLNGTTPQSRVVLPPSGAASSSYDPRPRGLDPEDGADRTTAIPLRRGAEVRQASLVVPTKSQPKADDGWRPSAE